ncbi:superoxide dismutase family protein [Janibacter limosus]|uniref:Superoxide dismutase family protein n=1 Tax=Janibacter limosus TaxID=53458 RepID=A0AC61U5T4_9MICO|nr:superoxide dismutase family protein [Janibacter limosus]UUZ45386.1 superoxide dismutase family protein [Janibacter limosus]
MKFRLLGPAAIVTASTFAASGAAVAAHDTNPSAKVASYSYGLTAVRAASVPGSAAEGSTRITSLPNGKVRVRVEARGVAPGLPHAMHLHGVDGPAKDMACPRPGG